MSSIITEARNAELSDVYQILTEQRARRLDVVVSAAVLDAFGGNLLVRDTEATQLVSDEGVTSAAGVYRPTVVGDEGLAALLGIDGGYLKKLRRLGRPDIWDANVNGMLHGEVTWLGNEQPAYPPYDGNILLRLLRGDAENEGVLRAALSPRYKFIDNLDVLTAVMEGLQKAGVNAVPDQCDLSARRMYARFAVPEIAVLAPKLLDGYRSPFEGPGGVQRAGGDRPGMRLQVERGGWSVPQALAAAAREGQGYAPGEEPVVFAGLIVSNSDTGGGARWLIPQIRIQVCFNGLTLIAEGDRKIHLGSTQSEGIVAWSAETLERELALITSQTVDLVREWMTPEWFGARVAEIEALAGTPLPEPERIIRDVTAAAGFTKAQTENVWQHFLRGGQGTAGGLANAVTSVSQTLESPDDQAEMDAKAVTVMERAAKIAAA